jgi:hypothetical protein
MILHPARLPEKLALLSVLAIATPCLAQSPQTPRLESTETQFTNATLLWDEGRYPDALRIFAMLISGNDANSFRERIALVTGENWSTRLVAENARNPRWSRDGRIIAMDVGTGQARVTRIVKATDLSNIAEIRGGLLVLSPDGSRAAYVAGTGPDGAVTERDLATGTERVIADGGLQKAQLAYRADGKTLIAVAAPRGSTRTEVFQATANAFEPLVRADSSIADVQVVNGDKALVYAIGSRSALGGGAAFARAPRTRFAIFDLQTRAAREVRGESPVVSEGGNAIAFIVRENGTNSVLRTRMSGSETETLHTTRDDLTGLAISPDGARVVFQQMPREDWELYVASVPGQAPVRLTGSAPPSLDQTLVATGFGYRVEQRRSQGAVVAQLLPRVRDIRRFGSAALDLCAVAAGRIDAYYELDLNPWDHAAGALVAAEAGIVVTGLPGSAFGEPMAIAAAPSIAGPFVALLTELHAGG